MLGIVIGVAGNGQGADGGKESPEASARDAVHELDPDALQDVFSRPQGAAPYDDPFPHACHEVTHYLRCGVAKQTVDHGFFRELSLFAENSADVGDHSRLKPPDGGEIRENGQPS